MIKGCVHKLGVTLLLVAFGSYSYSATASDIDAVEEFLKLAGKSYVGIDPEGQRCVLHFEAFKNGESVYAYDMSDIHQPRGFFGLRRGDEEAGIVSKVIENGGGKILAFEIEDDKSKVVASLTFDEHEKLTDIESTWVVRSFFEPLSVHFECRDLKPFEQ